MTIKVLIFLIWLWFHMHPPQLPNPGLPAEMLEAARAITVTATKWGHVADAFNSWNLPAAFALGIVVGLIVGFVLWNRKSQ